MIHLKIIHALQFTFALYSETSTAHTVFMFMFMFPLYQRNISSLYLLGAIAQSIQICTLDLIYRMFSSILAFVQPTELLFFATEKPGK